MKAKWERGLRVTYRVTGFYSGEFSQESSYNESDLGYLLQEGTDRGTELGRGRGILCLGEGVRDYKRGCGFLYVTYKPVFR